MLLRNMGINHTASFALYLGGIGNSYCYRVTIKFLPSFDSLFALGHMHG
jgi:hypothetical protein